MKRLLFIFVLLPLLLQGQIDTVTVYPGFDISYMYREDTVLMSQRKFNNIVSMFRSHRENDSLCLQLNDRYALMNSMSDTIAKEAIAVSKVFEETSIMYRQLYDNAFDQVIKMNGMLKDCGEIAGRERKRSWRQGAIVGGIGGLVVGLITTAIILK
jgi:hypothetical protein